ncbi:MFS transporter [Georgenia yuyongxinii]|uniref:MFS transporter n=1 Tax=Georgenia yuyongxinii TaxID=2589797 RepID=A0A552WV55_9MICO|nr:MFS transporter [Georgenia yuyongxinii]TRW46586.1 MFS transporter [Georgenia yuyongxinii]
MTSPAEDVVRRQPAATGPVAGEPAGDNVTGGDPAERRVGRAGAALLVVSLLAVAVNLRPALTSVGPLLPEIRSDDLGLGISVTQAGVLSTAPLLFFALGAPLAPRLARRFGLERTNLAVLVVVALALTVRPWGGISLLLLGTGVAAGAIAVANVLVPALIRRDLPRRTMPMMGAYSVTLALGATLAAGITVPVSEWLGGWRWALASWGLLAAAALALWAPRGASRSRADLGTATARQLWRQPLAWQVSTYLGTQSVGFYCMVAWLPTIARESGMTATESGLLLSTSILVGAASGLLVPVLSSRARNQQVSAAGMVLFILAGLLGLALAPAAAPWLWAVLLGIGQGGTFPLALSLIVLRSRTAADVPGLSAMAHSVGYLMAAAGPLLMAAIRESSGSWTPALVFVVGVASAQLVLGLFAGRARYVGGSGT